MKIWAFFIIVFLVCFEARAITKPTFALDGVVQEINLQRDNAKEQFVYMVESRNESQIIDKLRQDKIYFYINIKIRDQHILIYSIRNKMWKVVEELINGGTNLNAYDSYGKVPLMYAAEAKNKKIVEMLLNNDADPEAIDKNGISAAEYLKKNGMR